MDHHTKLSKKILIYFIMIVGVLAVGFPIVYAIFGSFKTAGEFLMGGSNIFPSGEWHWKNYTDAWKLANFSLYTMNSILVSLGSVVFTLITTTMAGYVFARANFFGKKFIFLLFGATMFIGGTVTLFPTYLIAKSLGLTNSLMGMIVAMVAAAQPMNVILVMGYISGISKEIDESAKLDGCGFFRIFWNILLPIVKPLIATIAILEFRSSWNNYMTPLAFTLSSPKLKTLTIGIVTLRDQGEGISAWNLMIAGTVMSLVPIMIVYLSLNNLFIAGITEGAIKG